MSYDHLAESQPGHDKGRERFYRPPAPLELLPGRRGAPPAQLLAPDFAVLRWHRRHAGARKEEPLYLHGGDSFFELLAPWILLKKC